MRGQTMSSDTELQKGRRLQSKKYELWWLEDQQISNPEEQRIDWEKGDDDSDGDVYSGDYDSYDRAYQGQVSSFGPRNYAIK